MYAAQEGHAHTQAGVNGTPAPPMATLASAPDYGHAYPGYSADGYSYYGYPQQNNPPHSQHMGGYDNSAASYHPANSYQNSGSYVDSAHYQASSTYYNPAAPAYQNPGSYQHSFSNQWTGNSYGNYGAYPGYQGYSQPEATGPNQAANNQYTQDYQQQWANYYASLQNGCKVEDADDCTAPGTEPAVTEKLPVSQPPPPGTQPAWDLNEPSYPDVTIPQTSNPAPSDNSGGFAANPSVVAYHGEQYSHIQPGHFQHPQFLQQSLQDQPLQFKSTQDQVPLLHGQQLQTQLHLPGSTFQQKLFPSVVEPLQRRVGKLQIPTNPRIVSTLAMNTKVTPADSSQIRKPAYITIEAKASLLKCSPDMSAETMLKPGMFPPSLRAYVERALARCKDEAQKRACQEIMKEMITTASSDGSLFTKNWDTEPLFPLPAVVATSSNEGAQDLDLLSSKQDRSPIRRVKSRWEPVADLKTEEKAEAKVTIANKDVLWNHFRAGSNPGISLKWEKQDNVWNKTKALLHQQFTDANSLKRAVKKARKSILGEAHEENNSSEESENEVAISGGVCLGTISTAETPEEKMRRQSRTKRFDKGKEVKTGSKELIKGKMSIGASASARRATALLLARSVGDGSGAAVEDINWDALTVKGTCQEVEKRYLRLTSAPDPNTVRPEEVLRKALTMVQSTQKNYLYKCEQLKSIRQDLTVQRIKNELTVQVYETHARMALEAGDLPEYNQCQSQLKGLYAEGIRGCNKEFAAYSLLYIIVHHGNSRDLISSMARLSVSDKEDAAIKHALAVRDAVAAGNYTTFFRLYKTAPNLGTCLMDLYVEKMRFEALRCMTRAYRPTLQVSYIGRILGFIGFGASDYSSEKDQEDLDECEEWLRAHGAILVNDNEGELCVDCKASMATLFMPEPEDAVAHGDVNLAVNDFLAQV
ncbi:hypothetical protein GOP47_0018836 [Adiantum capillus-veneris]|uniref:PCI domain-containing protein n=1 Tax=Adiantum capillus-veneris TaxID=13818 RepID=A0A9D4UEG4_ADICA|nr:hypothetical protein GOP47_0018836 [Adiantum capillus-veneris]